MGGCGGQTLSMQSERNLVIYDASRKAVIWATGTTGHASAFLAVQKDGNVVIFELARSDLGDRYRRRDERGKTYSIEDFR